MKNTVKKDDNRVFYISLAIILPMCLWAVLSNESFSKAADATLRFLTNDFGWLYLISMLIFVIFAIVLAFSKYGNIKLGPDNSKPEYSTSSWFAMLFGAGMGIGLIFWGVAEPLSHFIAPKGNIVPGSIEAADFAIESSFLHWGIHPWAGYSIIGLSLAYFQFRKGKSGLISSILEPVLGKRVHGWMGIAIDVLAVFATIAGIATSLGLGTMQINSGLNYLFNIPNNSVTQIIIIAITTFVFIATAVSGVDKGIKKVSDLNLILALIVTAAAFLVGPTLEIINSFTSSLGNYAQNILSDSLAIGAYSDNAWTNKWTVFYWAWWIAWAPFVGTFIARISKGRTIREFILGVMFAPAFASFIFFAIFGNLGINLALGEGMPLGAIKDIAADVSIAFFAVMSNYDFGFIISIVTIILLITFFITSANSATFVLGMFTSQGDLNPTNKKKIMLGLLQSFLAIVLLLTGGLNALQTSSLVAAFPFIFIMILAAISLMKELKKEDLGKNKLKEKSK
ncbi:MAG: BCCT family transporter [Romboutsia sp.]